MKKLIRILISYPAMATLLVIYAAVLAAATFIESKYGTPVARHWVYNNWLFFLLQLLLVVNFVGIAARQHLVRQRKWATLIFHYAFALILLGAMVTHLTGREGIMHIREGESSAELLDPADPTQVLETLPFSVELTDFRLVRYPGSHSPSSFESDVVVRRAGHPDKHENIYMNNVLHVGAYRLYQSSYDPDELGTVLSVNRDRMGTLITYLGYILLMGGMLVALFHKNSRFRTLGRMLGRKSVTAAVAAALLFGSLGSASAQPKVDTLTISQIEANSRRQMEQIEREHAEEAMREAIAEQEAAGQPVEMPGVLPLERILELRPDYRIAEQQLELSNQNVRVARSSYNPQLTVGVQGVYGTLQPNVTGEGKVYGLALAQLNVPIFRWNERRHEVNMARAAVRGSEWALVDAENTVNGDLAVARTNMERTREAVEMAEVNLNVALDNLMLNTFSYSEGRLPILDVLSAQLAWIQSYTAFVNSNYEYKVSIADYCKAQGTLTLQLGD